MSSERPIVATYFEPASASFPVPPWDNLKRNMTALGCPNLLDGNGLPAQLEPHPRVHCPFPSLPSYFESSRVRI